MMPRVHALGIDGKKPRKLLPIEADLLAASKEYVDQQLAIMRKHGGEPSLTPEAYDKLVYDCAKYPQQIRNETIKLHKARGYPTSQQFCGPEGSSLLCLVCNSYQYIETTDATDVVTCPRCKRTHVWTPRKVMCASPDHNDGCTNPNCFLK